MNALTDLITITPRGARAKAPETLDLFPDALSAARASYRPPTPPGPEVCAVEGCGAPVLPFSTFCVECDELPDYEFSDIELYSEPPPSWQEQESRDVGVPMRGPL